MKMTQLHKDYVELCKTRPSAKPEERAETLQISVDRALKIHAELAAEGKLPSCDGLDSTAERLLLEAANNSAFARPAEFRAVADVTKMLPSATGDAPPDVARAIRRHFGWLSPKEHEPFLRDRLPGIDHFVENGSTLLAVSSEDMADKFLEVAKSYRLEAWQMWVTHRPHLRIGEAISMGLFPFPIQPKVAFLDAGRQLESRKLGCLVNDDELGLLGICLSDEGIALAERLRMSALNADIERRKAAHVPKKVKCPSCCEYSLKTTWWFEEDRGVEGRMLAAISANGDWELSFGHEDTGASIVCPSCGASVLGPDGRVPPERICEL